MAPLCRKARRNATVIDEKRLQQLALAYPVDTATLDAAQLARELLAARAVVEAARTPEHLSGRCDCDEPGCIYEAADDALDAALAAYDEATR